MFPDTPVSPIVTTHPHPHGRPNPRPLVRRSDPNPRPPPQHIWPGFLPRKDRKKKKTGITPVTPPKFGTRVRLPTHLLVRLTSPCSPTLRSSLRHRCRVLSTVPEPIEQDLRRGDQVVPGICDGGGTSDKTSQREDSGDIGELCERSDTNHDLYKRSTGRWVDFIRKPVFVKNRWLVCVWCLIHGLCEDLRLEPFSI